MKRTVKKVKILSIISLCTLLIACSPLGNTSTSISDNALFSNSIDSSSSSSSSPITSNSVIEETEQEYNSSIGKDEVIVFQGTSDTYYRNDKAIKIEGPLPIIKDEMMYLPLELIFDLFNLSGYETLKETGKWENEFGTIEIYKGQPTSIKSLEQGVEETEIMSITWYKYDFATQKKLKDILANKHKQIIILEDTIYIPASLLNCIPNIPIKNELEMHQAKYFPNAEMTAIYYGTTPIKDISKYLPQEISNKSWEEVYTDIALGKDRLGMPEYLSLIETYGSDDRLVYISGYSLYDFNKDGTPEFLVQMSTRGADYAEVFTVEDGHSKYLGDVLTSTLIKEEQFANTCMIEKATGYILPCFYRFPYTYMFKDGRFAISTDYVEFGELPTRYGENKETYKEYNADDVWELSVYKTIEEAISAYPTEEYSQ